MIIILLMLTVSLLYVDGLEKTASKMCVNGDGSVHSAVIHLPVL